jgi:hypothetical protein
VYYTSLRQLAEAVLFYYQSDDEEHRDKKLRDFQRQFALPSNTALRDARSRPEMLELLLFCAEFLLNDAIKREDWKTLAKDFEERYNSANSFLRLYPGATPFLRRFNELLIHSAVLLHDQSEQLRDKEGYVDRIVRLLERMRISDKEPPPPQEGNDSPTLVYFFLPESNKPEEGLVIFFPQDGRTGTLYSLPLTRQTVKQGGRIPMLDERLLEQVKGERKIRVSWDDSATWVRGDDAMTERDYPYGDVLPLQ